MADILATCTKCGKTVTLSEYADESADVCARCGGVLRRLDPESEDSDPSALSRLTLLRRGPNESAVRSGESTFSRPDFKHFERVIPGTVEKKRAVDGLFNRWIGTLTLLLACVLFIGPQAAAQRYPALHAIYLNTRLYILAVIWLGVCVEAWRENAARGLLAIVFPPYVFLYAFGRLERAWLRSLVVAAALMLVAELYFLQSNALIREIQGAINRGILSVEEMLRNVSSPIR